jgi:hypothetical protein
MTAEPASTTNIATEAGSEGDANKEWALMSRGSKNPASGIPNIHMKGMAQLSASRGQ